MRSLPLRTRLLLWAGATSALTVVIVIVLVDVTFRANIREQLQAGLTLARQVVEDGRASQLDTHISEVATAALDTRLRASVATGDPATVTQTLAEVHGATATGWAAVVAPDGTSLASTADAPDLRVSEASSLVSEALYFDTGDLWVLGGELFEVAASAILFGAEPLAILVAGRPVDAELATVLEAGVGRPVAVVYAGGAVLGAEAASLSASGRRDLGGWYETVGDRIEAHTLGGGTFLVAGAPLLNRNGDRLGVVAVFQSYDEALAPSNALRVALIGILVLGLAVTFAVSGVFSRTITVPVGRLLQETSRLGHGDLEHAIVPVRNDEIGSLARSFDNMRVSLKAARADLIQAERLSAIGKAASAVAHDFTQPLSTIAGAVGLLRMDGASEDVRDRCFTAIEGELERLQRMKQEIVEFARGESTLDVASVRIDSFLENAVSAMRIQLAQRDIRLSVQHGYPGEWTLDSYMLERVLDNLVRNAAAAISSSGTITIRSELDHDTLVLEVEDDGPGIPADRLEEIFEPFVSFGKKEGTGLGLAIARNVVRQHGGTIHVTSDRGARFTLRLPRGGRAETATADATARGSTT
jgi:signal transduction histidine kinase